MCQPDIVLGKGASFSKIICDEALHFNTDLFPLKE